MNLAASLRQRPRILNLLHLFHLIRPFSPTKEDELTCLAHHAKGKRLAVEIGTAFGVSAVRIAKALDSSGRLYCIDTFEDNNPVSKICQRELRRSRLADRVTFLRGLSAQMVDRVPKECDFFFVDGDHSYEGLKTDWNIVLNRLAVEGIACFHDTTVPPEEPDRNFGSVGYFADVIRKHSDFQLLETRYSLNVIRRLKKT
jgi:predicted O-methyltransferase YrrM